MLDKVRDEEKEKYVDDMDVTVCNVRVLCESENGESENFFFLCSSQTRRAEFIWGMLNRIYRTPSSSAANVLEFFFTSFSEKNVTSSQHPKMD